jgi:hypothetical protein
MEQFIRAGINWRRGGFPIPEAKALALFGGYADKLTT